MADSTYQRQIAYLNKIAADFRADQLRKQAEIAAEYGTLADPGRQLTKTVTTKVRGAKRKKKYIKRHNLKGKDRYKWTTKTSTVPVYNVKKTYIGKGDEHVKSTRKTKGGRTVANYEWVNPRSGAVRKQQPKKRAEIKQALRKAKSPAEKRRLQQKLNKFDKKWNRRQSVNVKIVDRYRTTKTPVMTGQKKATEGEQQKSLRDTRERDVRDIRDDYAARGILHSGLFAAKRADYEKEFGRQLSSLTRKKTSGYNQLTSEKTQFERDLELQREKALLELKRRQAAAQGRFLE